MGARLRVAKSRRKLTKTSDAQLAWKPVKANKGAAGVDGLDIEQTAQRVRQSWPDMRPAPLAGTYRPSPVRKVLIDALRVAQGREVQCAVAHKALDHFKARIR